MCEPPPIYVVSGGTGSSGEQLVHTVLVQFPDNEVPASGDDARKLVKLR